MKIALWLAAGLVVFAFATSALWHTVGGLVEQAGAREERTVALDVRLALHDQSGQPLPSAPVRVVIGKAPEQQPPSAGYSSVSDATGIHAFTTRATIDKAARTRPTNWLDSLFAKAEQTDHVSVGVELGYLTYRWLYVADLYRFSEGETLFDGLSLYTRNAQGYFSVKAERDGNSWKIADLGEMRLTTQGYQLTDFAFERKGESDEWALSLTFTRGPTPVVHE